MWGLIPFFEDVLGHLCRGVEVPPFADGDGLLEFLVAHLLPERLGVGLPNRHQLLSEGVVHLAPVLLGDVLLQDGVEVVEVSHRT